MENLIKAFLDIFRTHNILLYVVCIASGLLSYNVFNLAELTGFDAIKPDYKNYVGLVFLFSLITILVLCIKSIVAYLRQLIAERKYNQEKERLIEQKLNSLTNPEKAVLLQYFIQNSETIWLPVTGQEVVELCNAHILMLASNTARATIAGQAVMLKLPMILMQRLSSLYPEVYSKDCDQRLVQELLHKFTPNSIREVNKNRQLFNY
ncbi:MULTISPECIES: super-infection exclusion protein B [unclassified Acinetobacter]|uniref:super-infection exclusion protein B n=1 Tax=unclassified Acinetobacter TaxID=196816 RepID=UPI0015D1B7E2